MRLKFIVGVLCLASEFAQAKMVPNNTIGNDPAKEALCASRAHVMVGPGPQVPFEIDSDYVASVRQLDSDTTFIVIDGASPQLVQCFLRSSNGRFEPHVWGPENPHWHVIKPRQFEPSINTSEGSDIASDRCRKVAEEKMKRPDFDNARADVAVVEVNLGSPLYYPGAIIGGQKAKRYDVVVKGTTFYKSTGPDLLAVNFECLFSPMLELKGFAVTK